MMLNDLQKRTAQAIVNIFETGHVQGDYARVTRLAGDSGGLTYGRSQTTRASGNLHKLIDAYCAAPEAARAADLAPYLPKLAARDDALDTDDVFCARLREAGADPVMRHVQDTFFDRLFWRPASREAARLGLEEALSVATVYDGFIHGSWARMRDRTIATVGTPAGRGARAWTQSYLHTRRAWLSGHANRLLHRTVYRMDALLALVDEGNWALDLPLTLRGQQITPEKLWP